jgi:hypothetical protein
MPVEKLSADKVVIPSCAAAEVCDRHLYRPVAIAWGIRQAPGPLT